MSDITKTDLYVAALLIGWTANPKHWVDNIPAADIVKIAMLITKIQEKREEERDGFRSCD